MYSLKAHFTSLVSTSFAPRPPPHAPNGQSGVVPMNRSASGSTADTDLNLLSPTISHQASPNPDSETDGSEPNPPGFASLLDEVLGSAPLVDPSVVEGGRRFIGNLMRTVGAAAGGSVPTEQAKGETQGVPPVVKEGNTVGGVDL